MYPDTREMLARFQFAKQTVRSGDEYVEFKNCPEYQEVDKREDTGGKSGPNGPGKGGEKTWSVPDLLGISWREVIHDSMKDIFFVDKTLKLKVSVFLKHRD